ELAVHKSTASRLLAVLDRRELVTQDTARGRFRLGVGIVRLAGAASARLDVVQESRPVCRALAQQLGETVNLAILSGRDALYLDQAAGPAALSPHNWAGRRIPLHATSDGKVLLAYLPEAELAASLTPPLARFTERTVTAAAEFTALLAGVRSRGFATAVDELEAGLTAIAAPVRNAEGTVIASVSVSGPSFRIPAARIPALAAAVIRAADEVSRRLGWAGLPPARGQGLTGEDLAQLAGGAVRVPVQGRFEVAALGRGGVRGQLALQRAAAGAGLLRPGLRERGRHHEHHAGEHHHAERAAAQDQARHGEHHAGQQQSPARQDGGGHPEQADDREQATGAEAPADPRGAGRPGEPQRSGAPR
ncbi:MAG TPA: IclR family transcriptional regulator, partial [Streptosporangiaceae bacterium]